MNQVIFSHTSDKEETVLFEGTKTACKKEIARLKAEAKKQHDDTVWGWCNDGFSVNTLYYVELR